MFDPLQHMGKFLVMIGLLIAGLGGLLMLMRSSGIPFFGKLPGDIIIQRKNFTFYFPLGTSILLSIILTLILYLISRR